MKTNRIVFYAIRIMPFATEEAGARLLKASGGAPAVKQRTKSTDKTRGVTRVATKGMRLTSRRVYVPGWCQLGPAGKFVPHAGSTGVQKRESIIRL